MYVRTYVRTYIHTYIHTYVCIYVPTHIDSTTVLLKYIMYKYQQRAHTKSYLAQDSPGLHHWVRMSNPQFNYTHTKKTGKPVTQYIRDGNHFIAYPWPVCM